MAVGQHKAVAVEPLGILRVIAQHPGPQLLIQPTWPCALIHEGPGIRHSLERSGDATGLIALIAVQDDAVLFHDAGDEIGTHRHPPRGDHDSPQIIQWHSSRSLIILPLAGDEPAFLAQHGTMLEDVEDVIAHELSVSVYSFHT